jgi:hypothetical protein
MRLVLKVTALLEAATGLGLVAMPSVVVRLLFGAPLDSSAATMLGRVAGVGCSPWRWLAGWRAI